MQAVGQGQKETKRLILHKGNQLIRSRKCCAYHQSDMCQQDHLEEERRCYGAQIRQEGIWNPPES